MIGEAHSQCLEALGASPSQFYDANPDRSKQLARQFGGVVSPSAESLIRSEQIDAVYICTHHDSHAPLAEFAATCGKHIFLEKPMALTRDDCERIVTAVERSGVLCMTGFKMRYYPLVEKARELVPNPLLLSAQILDRRWPDAIWANDPIKGGGNVLSQGCHAMDLLTYFAGSRPIEISAHGGNLHHPGLAITDALVATVEFDSGAIASVTLGDVGESPLTGKLSFQLADGSRAVHLHNRLLTLVYSDGAERHTFDDDFETGFLKENREFLAALEEEREPRTSHRDGMRATLMVLAGIESARTRTAQSLRDLP
jgi:predicted dehydrogenase